ncbi:crAss001_48 related protein [Acinetobacter ursingii]|uniref:crAss001_48 related protein n=1 Tax=Acinetobacter ursingii TaxID=108980 RepID=UPI001C0715C8|nr:hypothetical protein [Acinetobacter ursingii]
MSCTDIAVAVLLNSENHNRLTDFGLNPKNPSNFKVYIGTKVVSAMPMTREQYNFHQGWKMPEGENPKDEGYLVEYLDGGKPNHKDHKYYISWSPKDVFEKSYKASGTWLDRVKMEQADLENKINALKPVISQTVKPDVMTEKQWELLNRQWFHMTQYNQILIERIAEAEQQ